MRLPLDSWAKSYNATNPFGRDTTNDHPDWYPHASYHLGDDFIVPSKTPVYAPSEGDMLKVIYESAKGNVAIYVFRDPKGLTWGLELCHLAELPKLAHFKEGEVMAYTDNTGTATTGAHLHCALFKDGMRTATMNKIFQAPAGEKAHAVVKQMIADGTIVSPFHYFQS